MYICIVKQTKKPIMKNTEIKFKEGLEKSLLSLIEGLDYDAIAQRFDCSEYYEKSNPVDDLTWYCRSNANIYLENDYEVVFSEDDNMVWINGCLNITFDWKNSDLDDFDVEVELEIEEVGSQYIGIHNEEFNVSDEFKNYFIEKYNGKTVVDEKAKFYIYE